MKPKKTILATIIVQLCCGLFLQSIAQAASDDIKHAVVFDCAFSCGAPVACTVNAANLTGSDNPSSAFNYLVGKGVPAIAAAGIVGNLMWESGGVDPTAQQDKSKDPNPKDGVGFGIAQWTFTSRQAPLVALAQQERAPANTLGVQLDYLWEELSGVSTASPAASNYSGALKATEATTSAADAATVFMNTYERPDARYAHLSNRITNAQQILASAGGSVATAGASGGTTTGFSCSNGAASGNRIVQIALAEIGTNEGGAGTNAGGACKYQGSTCPPGEEWCADFVSWVYKQAGSPFTGGTSGGWRIPGAAAVSDWFKANGTWIPNPGHPVPVGDPSAPQPGDVIYYSIGLSHVNIVVSYDGTTVKTVGGNQGGSVNTNQFNTFKEAAGWGRLK